MATEHDESERLSAQATSARVRRVVGIVRAAGEEVSAEAIGILERVEREEIDTEEAVRLIIQLNSGG